MAQIIFEKQHDEYGSFSPCNVVLLAVHGAQSKYDNLDTLQMKQEQGMVTLIRFRENLESLSIELTDAEVDALIAARAAFKASVEEHKKQEDERVAKEIEEARALIESVRNEQRPWVLTLQSDDRYTLDNEQMQRGHLIHAMQPSYVLSSVKEFLTRQQLIEPEPKKTAGDDYDPFIDSDDLP